MLTQERVRELFDYREDGSLIWKVSRGSVRAGDVAGTLREDGYRTTKLGMEKHRNHRLVFLWHHGYMPENQVDHVDRNPENNRIENLREVGQVCNSRNSRVRADNSSGVVGVSWNVRVGKWQAYVMITNKMRHLGYSSDFTEAVAHRLAAEQCLNWGGCHNSTSAFLHMQKYLKERKQNEDA